MRTIKSVWTKPRDFFFFGLEELTSLSVLLAVKHTGSCEIYADDLGAEWIARLRLPVTRITRDLERCPGDGVIWNEGKIFCNSIQETPYLQTDLDVALGRDWPMRVKSAALVVERAYNREHPWLATERLSMPIHWRQAAEAGDPRSFACGTYGGNDLDAIREIAETGLEFIEKNRRALGNLTRIAAYLPVVVAEEWAIARGYDWMEVTTLLPSLPDGAVFAARSKAYMHIVGESKRQPASRADVLRRLVEIAPGQDRICAEVRKWIASLRG